jgi:F-type H+-transporting ATPase subunit delta
VLLRYLELYRQMRNITLARVTSATPLSDDQQAQLNERVQAIAGTKSVEFDLSVDPSLIGGFIVSLESQVIDASLAGQVRRLGLSLARV